MTGGLGEQNPYHEKSELEGGEKAGDGVGEGDGVGDLDGGGGSGGVAVKAANEEAVDGGGAGLEGVENELHVGGLGKHVPAL